MGLLQPEPGLLIWMTIAFLIVFGVLAKFGFPAIQKTLDERRKYIDSSLEAAGEAQRRLEGLQTEMDGVRQDAYKQKSDILKSAADAREKILAEARQRAGEEGERIIAAARLSARNESEAILREARHQVAMLSVAVSEKILRGKLEDPQAQTALAEKLLSEMERGKAAADNKEA
ncbi:MAG TPA: F0F1 ATP synthase subunit B [Candidatus Coprenecus stercoravium]|uniref:ATP synthase subunit b n=1 Tax=Candidatus Coprenecus stercoravium TaxID=2840735 RepID=A0A9D2GS98_9BACT|nr:F0F1 ATP synthase subunit B [Candidatus Coprenecus stercoravium]